MAVNVIYACSQWIVARDLRPASSLTPKTSPSP